MNNESTFHVRFRDVLHLRVDGPPEVLAAVDAAAHPDAICYINDRDEHLFLFAVGTGWPDRPANLTSDAYTSAGVAHGSDAAGIGFTRGGFSAAVDVEWAENFPRGNPFLRSVGALPVLHRADAELLVAKLAPLIDRHQPAPAPAPVPEPKPPTLAELLAQGERFHFGHERARAAALAGGWPSVPVEVDGRVPTMRLDQWGRSQFQSTDYGLPLGIALAGGLIALTIESDSAQNIALAETALLEAVSSSATVRPLLAIAKGGQRVLLLNQRDGERLRQPGETNARFAFPDALSLLIDRNGEQLQQAGGSGHPDDVRLTFRQAGTMIVHDYSWPDGSPLSLKRQNLPTLEGWRLGHVRAGIEKALAARALQEAADVPAVKPKAKSRAVA